MKHADVAEFWQWFSAHSGEVAEASSAADRGDVGSAVLQELDERVTRLGPFSWEVGLGEEQPNALAISPSGDYEKLPATRAIVAEAPSVPGWQFYPAKPPRQWDYTFRLHSVTSSYELNAKNWRYVLISYPDGMYDIDIATGDLAELPADTRREALEILVEGAIGEEWRIGYVGDIRFVTGFASGPGIPVPMLRTHLADLLRKAAQEGPQA
jgi:hypothetical protein